MFNNYIDFRLIQIKERIIDRISNENLMYNFTKSYVIFKIIAYIFGIDHNLPEHFVVLVIEGRVQDLLNLCEILRSPMKYFQEHLQWPKKI